MTGIVLETLKKKYFELLAKENMPATPKLTKQLDELQEEIKVMVSNKV